MRLPNRAKRVAALGDAVVPQAALAVGLLVRQVERSNKVRRRVLRGRADGRNGEPRPRGCRPAKKTEP